MSVDKFGHYLNDTSNIISLKNAPKLLGLFVDTNNNIDVQNKRIKNVAEALEENDVINKLFLQTQIEKLEEKLLTYFKADNTVIQEDLQMQIEELQREIKLDIEENYKIQKDIQKMKTSFEEQIEQLNEKIYRLENYMFVSIAESPSSRSQHSPKNQ